MAKSNDPSRRELLKCLLPVAVAPTWLVSKGGLAILEQPTRIITPEEVVDPRKRPWWETSQGAFMLKGSDGNVYSFLGLVTQWTVEVSRSALIRESCGLSAFPSDVSFSGSLNFVGTGGVKVND